MEFFTYVLPNGIRCIHKRVKSPAAHCALTINAGSRDELAKEQGLAHMVEHMLFKGTDRRKAFHINCRLENLGGELNAFTTKEETVIHATTLKGDYPKAVELISDIIFNSTFPEREVQKEKEIIFDEINSYKDSPADRIYDQFEDMLFGDSSLGHNILGSKSSLQKLGRRHIIDFISRTYNTDQMVFSSIGNISEKTFIAVADKYLGHIVPNPRSFERMTPSDVAAFNKTIHKSTYQAHCIVGSRAYDLQNPRRLHLSLLTNMLGGPSANSLLNLSLREKNGLSYNIEAGYTPMTDCGIASIYFSTDKDKVDRSLEIVTKEIDRLCTTPLTARKLSMAKKQFIGQMAIALESNESYMLSLGKSYLTYGAIDSIGALNKKVMSVTASDIMDVANETFKNTSSLIYR